MVRLFLINLILKVLDLVTTFFAVGVAGHTIEANPLMRFALINFGSFAYLFNFLIFGLANLLLYRRRSRGALIAVLVLMAAVVINNLIVCHRLGVF